MKIYTKIKIKLILLDVLFELAMWTGIIACALLHDRITETLFFFICWGVFRHVVPKEYHFRHSKKAILNLLGCLFWSNVIFWVVVPNMLPVTISIFSSVVAGMFVNYILYKFQDYLDLQKQATKQTINIYNMAENELRNYAKSKHLSEMMIDTLILKVVNNYKWCEIMEERHYSRTAIKYHKKCIEKQLNIKL